MSDSLRSFRLFLIALACAAWLFGPVAGAADNLITESAPMLKKWSPVYLPEGFPRDHPPVQVSVRFVVDAQGQVTTARVLQSEDARLDSVALDVVRKWQFTPGTSAGKPETACLDADLEFLPLSEAKNAKRPQLLPPLSQIPHPAERTEPVAKDTPPGEYPEILTDRKIEGAVAFAATVSREGRLQNPRVTGATHVDFVLPALEALKHWEFTPAMQGDIASSAPIEGKVTFDAIGDSREAILEANQLTGPDGGAPSALPEPYVLTDVAWPFAAQMAGESGFAMVDFVVRPDGATEGIVVTEASAPEFGAALRAAVETWEFRPAIAGGRGTAVSLRKRANLEAVPRGQESAANPAQRTLALLRAGKIGAATKLDAKLTPVYRVAPLYPASLPVGSRRAGRAEIEFTIDREGRCRFPRIVSATQPEFGWSAATAVAQWVFQPPMREGKPVDVLVKIPFEFAAKD